MQVPVLQIQDKINPEIYNQDDIYLITQFYVPSNSDEKRLNELQTCLRRNMELSAFKKIFMINEKEYTKEQLGLNDKEMKKVQQIIFNKGMRMKYSHAFALIKHFNLNGYIAIANSDIFFDESINNVRKTSLSVDKCMYALLRFEFTEKKLRDCKLFGPRPDSQDAWIIHSKFLPSDTEILRSDFALGTQGCDNVLAFLFLQCGYKIFNEPCVIKIYHYHSNLTRNYTLPPLSPPYLFVAPVIRS
jgi:hypothetical protein